MYKKISLQSIAFKIIKPTRVLNPLLFLVRIKIKIVEYFEIDTQQVIYEQQALA